jgi:hypothetical protein
MTNLRTIAAAIDAATEHGITGAQALRLLCEIRDMINDQEQLDDLEAEAERAQRDDAMFERALRDDLGDKAPPEADDGLCPVCGDDVSEPADGAWHCLACGHRWL